MEILAFFVVSTLGCLALMGLLYAPFVFRDKRLLERPEYLVKAGKELSLQFEPGKWPLFTLTHSNEYTPPLLEGSHRGYPVEVRIQWRRPNRRERERLRKPDFTQPLAANLRIYPTVHGELSQLWAGVTLRRWGLDTIPTDMDRLATHIGDEHFDASFALTGNVSHKLRELLLIPEVQMALEELGVEFTIQNRHLELPLSMKTDADEISDALSKVVDFLEVIEEMESKDETTTTADEEVARDPHPIEDSYW